MDVQLINQDENLHDRDDELFGTNGKLQKKAEQRPKKLQRIGSTVMFCVR